MPGMPARSTIEREIATNPSFSGQYRRARAAAGDFWADRVIEVAEDVLNGKQDPNASRVAIRSFMWAAAKFRPEIYGDRQQIDLNANVNVADTRQDAPQWIRDRLRQHKTIKGEAGRVDKPDADN